MFVSLIPSGPLCHSVFLVFNTVIKTQQDGRTHQSMRPSISPCPSSPTFSTNILTCAWEGRHMLWFFTYLHSVIHSRLLGLLVIYYYLLTVTTNNSILLWEHCNDTWERRVRIGFSEWVWRDVPEVDPETRGQENPLSTSTDKSIGNTFCVWTIIPLLYVTPLGIICLYRKVMIWKVMGRPGPPLPTLRSTVVLHRYSIRSIEL